MIWYNWSTGSIEAECAASGMRLRRRLRLRSSYRLKNGQDWESELNFLQLWHVKEVYNMKVIDMHRSSCLTPF